MRGFSLSRLYLRRMDHKAMSGWNRSVEDMLFKKGTMPDGRHKEIHN